jgi:hypothetical protein
MRQREKDARESYKRNQSLLLSDTLSHKERIILRMDQDILQRIITEEEFIRIGNMVKVEVFIIVGICLWFVCYLVYLMVK